MKKTTYEWKEVIPVEAEVVIAGKTYKLRKMTMKDSVYFDNKYGTKKFYQMWNENVALIFMEIAFRLITPNDWKSYDDFCDSMTPNEANANEILSKTMKAAGRDLTPVEVDVPDTDTFQAPADKPAPGKKPFFKTLRDFFSGVRPVKPS